MNEKILKISSITKKLLLGLFGAFLLVFLLFHMSANLFILADDGGDAYSAFCHFMGTNIFVKIAEIGLLGTFLLHICLSVILWWQNRQKRPVRYHQSSRTKTAKGSKLAIVTGSLMLVCILFHFYDFYFVKVNVVKGGFHMVKIDELAESKTLEETLMQVGPETYQEYINLFMATTPDKDGNINDMAINQDFLEYANANPVERDAVKVLWYFQNYAENGNTSPDGKWIRNITAEQRDLMQQFYPDAAFEPDFYNTAREKFSHWHIVLGYLVFFFLVGLHIRHGFESAFQTFGLNHYKYSRLVEILGIIYCWIICLGFAIVPLVVYFIK